MSVRFVKEGVPAGSEDVTPITQGIVHKLPESARQNFADHLMYNQLSSDDPQTELSEPRPDLK